MAKDDSTKKQKEKGSNSLRDTYDTDFVLYKKEEKLTNNKKGK